MNKVPGNTQSNISTLQYFNTISTRPEPACYPTFLSIPRPEPAWYKKKPPVAPYLSPFSWKLLTLLVVTAHGESQPSTSWRLGGWGRKSQVGLGRISHRWETHRGAKGAGKALKHWSRLEVLLVDFLCPRKQCLVLGSNENKLGLLKIWPKSNFKIRMLNTVQCMTLWLTCEPLTQKHWPGHQGHRPWERCRSDFRSVLSGHTWIQLLTLANAVRATF